MNNHGICQQYIVRVWLFHANIFTSCNLAVSGYIIEASEPVKGDVKWDQYDEKKLYETRNAKLEIYV